MVYGVCDICLKNLFLFIFTIQFVFAIVYGSYYTFWNYLWVLLYYFSELLGLSTVFLAKSTIDKTENWELFTESMVDKGKR